MKTNQSHNHRMEDYTPRILALAGIAALLICVLTGWRM
jgi:hypothetical protein